MFLCVMLVAMSTILSQSSLQVRGGKVYITTSLLSKSIIMSKMGGHRLCHTPSTTVQITVRARTLPHIWLVLCKFVRLQYMVFLHQRGYVCQRRYCPRFLKVFFNFVCYAKDLPSCVSPWLLFTWCLPDWTSLSTHIKHSAALWSCAWRMHVQSK